MAIFQVALIHPQDTIALSSMQAQASSQNLNENWRLTKFVQSDNLYPYNLFIGVMPNEYEKSRSNSTKFPIYIWTNKHLHPKEVKESMVDLVGRIYDELEEILREPLSVAQLNIVVMNDFNGD
uniref:Uncharacterized protein n=1 Tax=Acrobeloides nanus TaxID=290746 RepID=A0A914D1P6_9BILA